MFCYNCGMKIENKVRFCPNCGAKLVNEQTVIQPVAEPVIKPIAEPVVQPVNVHISVPQQPVVSVGYVPTEYLPPVEERTKYCVKKSLSSALFLIAVILFTLSTVFGFISLFSDNLPEINDEPGLFDMVSVSVEDYSLDDEFYNIVEFFDASIVWVVGFWLTFILAKSKRGMNTGGIFTLKIAAFIDRIFAYAVATFIVFEGIATLSVGTDAVDTYTSIIFGAPIFVGIGFVIVLFFHKACSVIEVLRSIAATGNPMPTDKLSRFVGIGCFVIAVMDISTAGGGWISIVTSLIEGIACLLFGICFFVLKKRLKALSEEYNIAYTPAMTGQTITNNNVMI